MALGDIAKLSDSGREKGCLTYWEVNYPIPHDVNSSEVMDDLFDTFGTHGIEVLEGQPKLPSSLEKGLENEGGPSNEVELDLTLGTFEKIDDLVRIYLRQQWRSKYVHLMMRRGRKTAKVAMARKLAVHLYWMMRQGWDYQQSSKFGSHAGQPGHRDGGQ